MEPLFVVDEKKCKKDGICATECPLAIIDFSDSSQIPKPFAHSESMCINCGHCVAVCPHGAIALKTMAPEQCLEVDKDLFLSEEQVEQFLRSRRSIRVYKDKAVDKDKLEKLIQISAYAPSGHNSQPVIWQVINGKEKVKEFSAHVIDWMKHSLEHNPEMAKMMHFDMITGAWDLGVDVVSRGCPALVLTNGGAANPFADAACKIAVTFFDLAAPAQGLGTCWNGFFNRAVTVWEPLQKALGLNDQVTNYGAIMVGYPKFKYSRMPTRNTPQISWVD